VRVLVLNPGSSTLKASLVTGAARDATDLLVEWPAGRDEDAPRVVAEALDRLPDGADAVGYRVVHGGEAYRAASLVTQTGTP
jgi:acetate kinase